MARLLIRRRMKIGAPYVPQGAIGDPLARTNDSVQGALGRSPKSSAIGRRQRTTKAADQLFSIEVRCCHGTALHERVRPSRDLRFFGVAPPLPPTRRGGSFLTEFEARARRLNQ